MGFATHTHKSHSRTSAFTSCKTALKTEILDLISRWKLKHFVDFSAHSIFYHDHRYPRRYHFSILKVLWTQKSINSPEKNVGFAFDNHKSHSHASDFYIFENAPKPKNEAWIWDPKKSTLSTFELVNVFLRSPLPWMISFLACKGTSDYKLSWEFRKECGVCNSHA